MLFLFDCGKVFNNRTTCSWTTSSNHWSGKITFQEFSNITGRQLTAVTKKVFKNLFEKGKDHDKL